MNYEFKRYECSDLVRLDIFVHGEQVEAFSLVVIRVMPIQKVAR